MHILLTDVVTCPRCGPEFGLIVLADRMEERHILAGKLGCANCREAFAIEEGVVDLRWPSVDPVEEAAAGQDRSIIPADPERPYRDAALLGITGPAGPVAVVSDDPSLVDEVQAHLPHLVVVGVSAAAPPHGGRTAGGWLLVSRTLPFRSRSLGGLVISAADTDRHVAEGLRSLGPGGRVVVDPAGSGTAAALLREDAELLLEQDGVAVASGSRAG